MTQRQLPSLIDGEWVTPQNTKTLEVINPATTETLALLPVCGAAEVDRAVCAARRVFAETSALPMTERVRFCEQIIEKYQARYDEIADAIRDEMGAPHDLAHQAQAAAGVGHFESAIRAGTAFADEQKTDDDSAWVYEPIGVCALIIPWNWPMNQLAAKVAPALISGCTVVLKPSELTPVSAQIFAEIIQDSDLPKGAFNMLHGDGATTGAALVAHSDVDKIAFTGSTQTGIAIAKTAADGVKRVTQELGGKSPNIIFADADVDKMVKIGVRHCFNNSGQSCNAPTRMLVERSIYDRAIDTAKTAAEQTLSDDPQKPGRHLGPVVSQAQYDKIQKYIKTGIDEARLVTGGLGRPEGLADGLAGYYVKPTVFADVDNQSTIAREEIFGPVLCMIPFDSEEEAVTLANDTPYGLAAYLSTEDKDKAMRVARKLQAGSVHINGASQGYDSPFGGYKQSGNGRERGSHGLREFFEVKSINGV